MMVPPGGTLLNLWPEPDELPDWLTKQDIDTFAAAFAESGFTGGLSWYRNIDRNWELTAPWHHAPVRTPALFIAGERELHFQGGKEEAERLLPVVPNLRRIVVLRGCGHWVQQERPAEVNATMIEFLRSLPRMHTDQGPSPSEDDVEE